MYIIFLDVFLVTNFEHQQCFHTLCHVCTVENTGKLCEKYGCIVGKMAEMFMELQVSATINNLVLRFECFFSKKMDSNEAGKRQIKMNATAVYFITIES